MTLTEKIHGVMTGDLPPDPTVGTILLIARGYVEGLNLGTLRPGLHTDGYLGALRVAMADEVVMDPARGIDRKERCNTAMIDYWTARL
jgi:hypothetical protein